MILILPGRQQLLKICYINQYVGSKGVLTFLTTVQGDAFKPVFFRLVYTNL